MTCPRGHGGPFRPIDVKVWDPELEDRDWLQCVHPGEKAEDGYCDERFPAPELEED